MAQAEKSNWIFSSKLKTYLDVSENSGTPKSSILIGFSMINHPLWGTTIFGNIHLHSILNFHRKQLLVSINRIKNLLEVFSEDLSHGKFHHFFHFGATSSNWLVSSIVMREVLGGRTGHIWWWMWETLLYSLWTSWLSEWPMNCGTYAVLLFSSANLTYICPCLRLVWAYLQNITINSCTYLYSIHVIVAITKPLSHLQNNISPNCHPNPNQPVILLPAKSCCKAAEKPWWQKGQKQRGRFTGPANFHGLVSVFLFLGTEDSCIRYFFSHPYALNIQIPPEKGILGTFWGSKYPNLSRWPWMTKDSPKSFN